MANIKVLSSLLTLLLSIYCTNCGVHPDGISEVSRYQDDLGNYQFGYKISSNEGEQFRQEGKDVDGRVVGSYGLTEADGRQRIVEYVADKEGFRAHIHSNEPGIINSVSAAATVHKPGHGDLNNPNLEIAASGDSLSSSDSNFGDRLKTTGSRVTYSRPPQDETPYRISSPDYRLRVPSVPEDLDNSRRQPNDLVTPGRYYPPINPYAATPPSTLRPHSNSDRNDLQRPITPPYGGYENRYPSTPSNEREFERYPSGSGSGYHGRTNHGPHTPLNRPLHHSSSRFAKNIPLPPRDVRIPQYERPVIHAGTVDTIPNQPNLLLRAVQIENGIQAVHVDPQTGRVYDAPQLPLSDYRKFEADRGNDNSEESNDKPPSISSHRNNYFSDTPRDLREPFYRDRNTPVNYRPPIGSMSSHSAYSPSNNRPAPGEASLSKPSARDLDHVYRRIQLMNEFYGNKRPADNRPNQDDPHYSGSRPNYPYAERYPGPYGIVDISTPFAKNEFDRDIGPVSFDEYPPRTPNIRPPSGFYYPEFDEPPFNGYRSTLQRDIRSDLKKEDSQKDETSEKTS